MMDTSRYIYLMVVALSGTPSLDLGAGKSHLVEDVKQGGDEIRWR